MILGIGIDLIEIDRIRKLIGQAGDRFMEEILADSEREYCLSHRDPAPSAAARFAAKEAVFKALGTGKRGKMKWKDVIVKRNESGKPSIRLEGETRSAAERLGVKRVHLNLTHTDTTAAAVAILETI